MVPDPAASDTASDTATDADDAASLADLDSDDAYALVYRATRDAVWDVVGTATLILFYLAVAAIALSVAFGGIGPWLRGSASLTALVIGGLALAVGTFAALRVYRLVTE